MFNVFAAGCNYDSNLFVVFFSKILAKTSTIMFCHTESVFILFYRFSPFSLLGCPAVNYLTLMKQVNCSIFHQERKTIIKIVLLFIINMTLPVYICFVLLRQQILGLFG